MSRAEYMRSYAQTPQGKAARARARANYLQQRKERGQGPGAWKPAPSSVQPLAEVIATWRTN